MKLQRVVELLAGQLRLIRVVGPTLLDLAGAREGLQLSAGAPLAEALRQTYSQN